MEDRGKNECLGKNDMDNMLPVPEKAKKTEEKESEIPD